MAIHCPDFGKFKLFQCDQTIYADIPCLISGSYIIMHSTTCRLIWLGILWLKDNAKFSVIPGSLSR